MALGGAWVGALVGTAGVVDARWWALAALVSAALALVWARGRGMVLGVALALVMAAIGAGRVDLDRRGALAAALDGANGSVLMEIRGVVVERVSVEDRGAAAWEPAMWSGVIGRTAVRVEAVRRDGVWVEAKGGRGELGVTLGAGAIGSMGCGDRVELLCSVRGISGAKNPGEPDWRVRAAHEGIVGRAHVDGADQVRVVGRGGVLDRVRAWRAGVRGRAIAALGLEGAGGAGVDDARRVVGALTLGERGGSTRELERAFARTGVAHVLAVSGLHVGVLAAAAVWLGIAGGERGRVRTGVVLGVIGWVVVMFPLEVPIVRALVLLGALALARGLGRRLDPVCVVCWAGVGLLVWRPMDAGSMGYQLSVGITGLLLVMGTRERDRALGRVVGARGGWMRRAGRGVWGGLKVNAACWAVATPVVVAHTGVVSLSGAVLAWAMALLAAVVLVLGSVQAAVGMVWGEAAARTAWIVDGAGGWMVGVVRWVDGSGWSSVRGVSVGEGIVGWVWAALAAWAVWIVVTRARVWRVRRWWVVGAMGVLVGWVVGVNAIGGRVDGVRVDMLAVEDGSAIVVRSGGGGGGGGGDGVMLYDAGSLDFRAAGMIDRALRSMGVGGIDVVVVSHDNIDHFGALPELAAMVPIGRVVVGGSMEAGPSAAWRAAADAIRARGVEVGVMRAGDRFALGDAEVVCVRGGGEEASVNDRSLVVRVAYGDERAAVLLTGDIGGRAIGALMAQAEGEGWIGGVRVMEMPHHGSWNTGAAALVEVVDPGVVLQSTGAGRVGDARYDAVRGGRVWLATGDEGAVWAEISGDGAVDSGRFGGESGDVGENR